MTHRITLIPGNRGESSAHTDAVCGLLEQLGVDFEWDVHFLDAHALTPEALASARETKTVLLPFLHGRRDEGIAAPIVQLRRELKSFANIRPLHSLVGVNERFPDVDVFIVRETTEDIYAKLEHESISGVFESLKVTTETACRRIARRAFELARAHGRKKVTTVHKSNIMKMSDGMFLRVSQEVAQDFPDIEHDERIVDALCMQLVMYPGRFDVLLCGNLFGDIVSDLTAGLIGGTANCPSVNESEDGTRIYTAGLGDKEAVANSSDGNPMSLLFASVLMLRDLGESEAADRLMNALKTSFKDGAKPLGVGGELTLSEFSGQLAARL